MIITPDISGGTAPAVTSLLTQYQANDSFDVYNQLWELTMPVFVCRWPNADFSAVSATSREEALELLSEVGNAASSELFVANNFMVHFHIKNEPDGFEEMLPLEFGGFGEQTHRMLCERVYPAYCAAVSEIDKDRPGADDLVKEKLNAASKLLKDALGTERKRQHVSASPELGTRRDDPKTLSGHREAEDPGSPK